jgi:hypothetical protein
MRIVQSERVFQAVERSKHEHERFYRASAALNRALTLAEVYDAAIEGARGACEFDFAAIATYDSAEGNHVLSRVVGEGADELAGRTFCDPGSIASMVVKNKLALPAAGDWRDRGGAYLFEPRERFKGFESLYVLPLLVKDEVMGVGTRRRSEDQNPSSTRIAIFPRAPFFAKSAMAAAASRMGTTLAMGTRSPSRKAWANHSKSALRGLTSTSLHLRRSNGASRKPPTKPALGKVET